ncbi:Uncharacterised protein [Wolbachia endosymbiont wPip_Mol of Culex molestus]|uniref:Jg21620 protein n=1 Tax=Pararge aegeria aegeria TaxID=348720 RepID=A0A8S4QKC3_9NEOP|nr:jg21620 [Pararge aegeria aegeria]CQD10349.1 Uncharacterised protein [Wolbachia endosymbiont wPip_Mol of Culex molestus]
MLATNATLEFTLSLSFIVAPCEETDAIVVSDIIERLSPNTAPPTTVAVPISRPKAPFFAKLTAIGTINTTTPIDVPIAVDIKAEAKNTPGSSNLAGRNLRIKSATVSALPID